jgi:hypothetical protein
MVVIVNPNECLFKNIKEIIVFKNSENRQVVNDIQPQEKLGFFSVGKCNTETVCVVEQGT